MLTMAAYFLSMLERKGDDADESFLMYPYLAWWKKRKKKADGISWP